MPKQVPAHKPSLADPIAAAGALLFTVLAAFGLDLGVSAQELAVALGSIATLAATIRTVWQRQAAR